MRIAMLGWEFPPFSAGGLGVHCRELTYALAALGIDIDFYMPRTSKPVDAPWMRVIYVSQNPAAKPIPGKWAGGAYASGSSGKAAAQLGKAGALSNEYGLSFFQAVEAYNNALVEAFGQEHAANPYSLVHAHDWITARAGVEIRKRFGVPLVQTIHSTEYDRTGNIWPYEWILGIERDTVATADRVIAVSGLTRQQLIERFNARPEKVKVVYNGVNPWEFSPAGSVRELDEWARGPVVLFHGRLSIQKGAEFFLKAAKRILEDIPNAHFVVSGKGDMLPRLVDLAIELGIFGKVLFTGYTPPERLSSLYAASNVYVLPSVSEPFGITVLESMSAGTPVVLSKTSGVGEAVRHALKVDFWDTDEMANKIVALLRYSSLSEELEAGMASEVRLFSWDRAARGTLGVYKEVGAA